MRSFEYKGQKFYHGEKVQCTILEKRILDAKISIGETGNIHICQNEADGGYVKERLGYKFSWFAGSHEAGKVRFLQQTSDLMSAENYEIY